MGIRQGFGLCLGFFFALAAAGVCAQGYPSVSRQIFSDADQDRDGFVSLDEFHKDVVRSFHALDFDRDGYITAGEVNSLPHKDQVKAMLRIIRRADANGDNRLSFREVVEARMKYFDEADTNKDDLIGLDEAMSFDAQRHQRLIEAREARNKARKAN